MQNLQEILSQATDELGISVTDSQINQLLDYAVELEKWNKTYNLTAVRKLDEIVKRHVVDALSVVPYIQELSPKTLADIGTGGGVPGVILAIIFPELQIDLVESIGKKCRFLRHIAVKLGLSDRLSVRQVRVESWQVDTPKDIIICRAFTSLENFTTITRHLGDEKSHWLAMKSAYTAEEESLLPSDFRLLKNYRLTVPFEEAERHLLIMKRI